MMTFIRTIATAAALLLSAIGVHAQGYGKVQMPWFQQGKIAGGVSVTAISAATQLPAAGLIAWICNTGATDAYLGFGTNNTATATVAGSSWLASGKCAAYDLNPFNTINKYVAAITASSTTTLAIETGLGNPPVSPSAIAQQAGSAGTISGSLTNPTSTLTLPATTTAYTSGQLIANSATAGSVVNPSFAIANAAGGASISRLRLSVNDSTSTAWAGQTVQVDLWTTTPTWTNGDRATWAPATGASGHLATFSCVFTTPVWGDGSATECSIGIGNFSGVKLASGTSVFWSLRASTGSGVTGASKVFTLTPELLN